MKRIRKIYVPGSTQPMYIGNGIHSIDRSKINKFVQPQSTAVKGIIA